MSTVLVDWLGRGGIAQCTESWAMSLTAAGLSATIVTRPDRELGAGIVGVHDAPRRSNRFVAHVAVARRAVQVIKDRRPTTVVVQNYIVPALEAPVYRAAKRVGARLVVVIHDHRLHSRWAGTATGLGPLLRRADAVVAHSRFVADAVGARIGRQVEVIPHPVQTGLLAAGTGRVPFARREECLLAVHFGVLYRSYKGTSTIVDLSRSAPEGWEVAVVGVGAPAGVLGVNRFVEPAELVAVVRAAAATLLPYRWATQSGAVVLAQALGSVPVASDVGGISEQIESGVTGLLLPRGAPVAAWRLALDELSDDSRRASLVAAAHRKVSDDHRRFETAARRLSGVAA